MRLISGVGSKGPACFLLEASGKRLLLDLGEGPPPGCLPDVEGLGPVDAVVLSHGHKDHVGGLRCLPKLGNPPVYATETVARALPKTIAVRPLPVGGKTDVLGIAVETGRNGHAPGGIWLHFGVGDGFLYTGDYSRNSSSTPTIRRLKRAATALIDCSYGDYQKPLADCWSTLAPFLARGPLLLPVPANGRGPEIALELMRHGVSDIYVDDAMRNALRQLGDSDRMSLRAGIRDDIERLAVGETDRRRARRHARGIRRRHVRRDHKTSSRIRARQPEVTILFTGYVNPDTPAERLTKSGRAQTMRWNVHPRLADTVALVQAVQAKTVIPAFCDRSYLAVLASALAPARVTMDGPIAF